MQTSKMKIFILVAVATILVGLQAQAQDVERRSVLTQPRPVEVESEWKPHFGLLAGAAFPERSGVTASEFGLDFGYQPFIPFGLGAELSHARIDDGTETRNRTTLWAKGSYNFGGDIDIIRYSYVAAGLGAVFKDNGTSLAVAPIVGFDIPLGLEDFNRMSLGASARYAFVADDEVDTFSLSAVAKYWY